MSTKLKPITIKRNNVMESVVLRAGSFRDWAYLEIAGGIDGRHLISMNPTISKKLQAWLREYDKWEKEQ